MPRSKKNEPKTLNKAIEEKAEEIKEELKNQDPNVVNIEDDVSNVTINDPNVEKVSKEVSETLVEEVALAVDEFGNPLSTYAELKEARDRLEVKMQEVMDEVNTANKKYVELIEVHSAVVIAYDKVPAKTKEQEAQEYSDLVKLQKEGTKRNLQAEAKLKDTIEREVEKQLAK